MIYNVIQYPHRFSYLASFSVAVFIFPHIHLSEYLFLGPQNLLVSFIHLFPVLYSTAPANILIPSNGISLHASAVIYTQAEAKG